MDQEKSLLLIEDEPDTVILYQKQLSYDGFTVQAAADAEAGLKSAKEGQPDLILLDLMLPGKSGFEVLAELKNDPATRDIPVLALTNLAEEVGHERAIALGADGYIIKAERKPSEVSVYIRQILKEVQNR